MNYIDVVPDPASSAARNTANTAPTWASWASAATGTLDSAAISSKDSVVTQAFKTFHDDVKPRVNALSKLAEKQGVDLGWSVQYAMDGDDQASADQNPALAGTTELGPVLNRPVNLE
ncbi:hypothetical protein [Solicola gregarius]|uniref:Uncharacterized protein n=1 Tax=Solicola gregarius TaxID=2908642 RepID=A0AA46TM15_9ACTN|nr:hypothetical protein [Solicola gregarius]UYM07771.1 hypothetical protein L0C25_12090 [Solicola gregarius]